MDKHSPLLSALEIGSYVRKEANLEREGRGLCSIGAQRGGLYFVYKGEPGLEKFLLGAALYGCCSWHRGRGLYYPFGRMV